MSKEQGSQMAEFYYGDFIQLSEDFPNLFCRSSFLAIYSFFEHEMLSLCRRDAGWKKRNAPAGTVVDEAKVKYLDDAVKYWAKAGVDATGRPEWTEIENLRDVRNQIAHEDGRRDGTERSKRVDAYVKARTDAGKPGITFKTESLVVGIEFCQESLQTIQDFFEGFIRSLP